MIDSGTLLQGRFLIEEKIGMGGMGAVYRALDQKFGSLVAIKETFYGDTELAEAFEREARLLNGLHHPILPHVSDSFAEGGGHFLVMEFIEGEDLSEILKRGEILSVSKVLGWTLDILDGLDYLHSQNPPVIHRDIKPNNLKLTSRGKIVLLDFGMAKETTGNTISGKSVFGYSRRYSSLEQIEGTGTDPRSDIFSLGATIYHLLTGQAPADALARASAIVAGRPDPLVPANQINPEVPESVTEILNYALALSAENRLGSAREMSSALESAIATVSNIIENETTVVPTGIVSAAAAFDPGEISGRTSPGLNAYEGAVDITNRDRDTTRGTVASIPVLPTRIGRPAPYRYAVGLALVLLCVALALFGTYRGLRGDASTADSTTESDTTAAGESISDIPQASVEPAPINEPESGEESPVKVSKDVAIVPPKKDSVTTRRTVGETKQESETGPVRPADRREETRRLDGESRPRRVVRPAFEQPSVSSIEAIMTGVPYERRSRRMDERDTWTEDELRRRRQMRREQRRQQQPY